MIDLATINVGARVRNVLDGLVGTVVRVDTYGLIVDYGRHENDTWSASPQAWDLVENATTLTLLDSQRDVLIDLLDMTDFDESHYNDLFAEGEPGGYREGIFREIWLLLTGQTDEPEEEPVKDGFFPEVREVNGRPSGEWYAIVVTDEGDYCVYFWESKEACDRALETGDWDECTVSVSGLEDLDAARKEAQE